MDKRGLSAVVTTLIIILLVIVSIGIIWVVIRNIITEGAGDISFDKFTLDLSIKSAYIDGSDIKVGVRRSPGGGDITGIKFVFFNGRESISIDRNIALKELEERTFAFTSVEVPGIGGGDDVSVAPIFESSGAEEVGSVTDTEKIASQPPAGVGGNGGDGTGATCDPACVDPLPHCVNGFCLECTGDPDCSPGVCNPDGQCVECNGDPDCSAGNICDLNLCAPDTPQSTGVIFSAWPTTSKRFFDSANLPNTDPDWVSKNHYVNFSSTEARCILIFDFIVGSGVDGDYSYIRLGLDPDDPAPQISGGDGYQVWRTVTCGPV